MSESFNKKHLDVVDATIQCRNFIQEYYPKLISYANGEIIHAASMCVLRMIRAKNQNPEYINYLQKQYWRYEWDYLKKKHRFVGKLFSICAYISVKYLIKISINLKNYVLR